MRKPPPTGIRFKKPEDYAFIKPSELFCIIVLGWMLFVMVHAEQVRGLG
jgi:hypothetical protein